jgi:hypothetical protein
VGDVKDGLSGMAPFRQRISSWRDAILKKTCAPSRHTHTGRPLIAGLLDAPMGLGAGARLLAHGLRAIGVEPATTDLTAVIQPDRRGLGWDDADWPADDGRGPVILHINPPELKLAWRQLGPARLRNRFLIGYWAWELPVLDPDWIWAFNCFHEIWVPSEFVADSLKPHTSVPVRVIGYPAHTPTASPETVFPLQSSVRQSKFKVLCACDLRSSVDRKNPLGAVLAFRAAFPDTPDVSLIIKLSDASAPGAILSEELVTMRSDPRITIIDENLDEAAYANLLASVDLFVSLHRSEGYGLSIARALWSGTPTIMTGWSGNMDFADSPGAFQTRFKLIDVVDRTNRYEGLDTQWAEPDLDDAAALIRHLYSMSKIERQNLRQQIVDDGQDRFSARQFAEKLAPVLHHMTVPANGSV